MGLFRGPCPEPGPSSVIEGHETDTDTKVSANGSPRGYCISIQDRMKQEVSSEPPWMGSRRVPGLNPHSDT